MLEAEEVRSRNEELRAFEARFDYPLGHERFRIDRGCDYLAFFETLGRPYVFAAYDDRVLVGVLVAVLRDLTHIPGIATPCYYLGDLKVAPSHRSAGISRRLLRAFDSFAPGRPAYGISMDPASGTNRVAATMAALPGVARVASLLLFSFDDVAWRVIEPLCTAAWSLPIQWVDHAGRKDIVLLRDGRPLPLRHLQHGPLARDDGDAPRAGSIAMLCLVADHPLATRLLAAGHDAARASILERACPWRDWSFVLSSDI
ncbi:MAG TPA: GNAT family N-acetyltransferase [Planctomycetota bacterium]|nr:GNAT family N-acetyltransferase [Planctomycetota bacterium]